MRRHSGCLLELLDEIAGVVEAYFQCDLCDRGVGMQKQRLGFLDAQVYLELWVKVREDWRNRESDLRATGYEE